MVAGREFDDRDRPGAAPAVVLSETAARTLFGVENPVGRMVSLSYTFDAKAAAQVIGVAHDVRFGPRDPYAFQIYRPFSQAAIPMTEIVVRAWGDPGRLADAVRSAIHELGPAVAVGNAEGLQQRIESGLQHERMMALLSACFGVLALVLTAIGLYGVIAYAVQGRTQEIGIRIALGAARSEVALLLLREVAARVAAILAIGGAATLAAGRSIGTLLYGVAPGDLLTLITVAGALATVAALAAWLPARRAARMDPMEALRQE
jgi:hypothetical protein